MKYDWVLLDADNTFLDFERGKKEALSTIFKELGFAPSAELFKVYGDINKGYWTQLEEGKIQVEVLKWKRFESLALALGVQADPHVLADLFIQSLSKSTHLVENARLFLAFLYKNVKLGLATNGIASVQRSRLRVNDLEKYFAFYAISEEIGSAKPNTAFFEFAFKQMGNPPKEKVLMIGDSLKADIAGGIQYGVDTCWFNHDQIVNETQWNPTYEIEHLLDIELI